MSEPGYNQQKQLGSLPIEPISTRDFSVSSGFRSSSRKWMARCAARADTIRWMSRVSPIESYLLYNDPRRLMSTVIIVGFSGFPFLTLGVQ